MSFQRKEYRLHAICTILHTKKGVRKRIVGWAVDDDMAFSNYLFQCFHIPSDHLAHVLHQQHKGLGVRNSRDTILPKIGLF